MPGRKYKLSDAAIAQRRSAAKRGGEATASKARAWSTVKLGSDTLVELDQRRGRATRDAHVRMLLGMPPV